MDGKRPLLGKHVLITRAKEQSLKFAKRIEEAGGVPVITPLLKIEANHNDESVMKKLQTFDSIVFTSVNGVIFFKQYLDLHNIPFHSLNSFVIAAVGIKTRKEIESLGVSVQIMPTEFIAEELADEIANKLEKKSSILIVRGNLARPVLIEHLKAEEFTVTDLVVYNTIHNDEEEMMLKKLLEENKLDFITFTSPSTVHSFMKIIDKEKYKKCLEKLTIVSIGPITNNALKEYGLSGFMPLEYTTDKMVELMESICNNGRNM
ncbi:uroporphyrinogen-III synthase [Metabacillus fastidiosus]|uniref:uroporphyrinogen-III synthase n=1 Tax=Metabacillus fastidiosus TaxID=1458 RepID=UPI003D289969